ncbi:MAG: M64 family metallopeptidase [Bacteroidota bacterium]|nr:M64 family metallopeptidase [Bacteroidota bacterium]
MKRVVLIVLMSVSLLTYGQVDFDEFFENKTLRLDYYHTGDNNSDSYSFDKLLEEPYWGGSHVNLLDTFQYGNYYYRVFDVKTNREIYSRGYSTLFREWQTTAEAKEIRKTFSETVVMPYPKNDVRVEFLGRDEKGVFKKKYEYVVEIDSYFIKKEQRLKYPKFDVLVNGKPEKKVDIVIIPEGYTKDEMGLFIKNCEEFKENLFKFSPYKENRDKFNIYGVLAPSQESGNDIPADGIWKNTILNSKFYTFDSERYCMTSDNESVRDVAGNAPYDQIYILINTDKYGGGAIYNHYNSSVNSNSQAAKIFIHELGHGFAALGDEYYNSSVSYSDFYDLKVEPWEPNITTLVDFDSKWKHLIKKGVPIPTPDTKEYVNTLGVFEGGGYVAKGVYRPAHDCLMNSFRGDRFCDACNEAIQEMINFYCE